jgi:serine/threonine protein phosphatase 1
VPTKPSLASNERIYAVGDIHGRLDLFEQIMSIIRADNASRPPATVRIVLLGDLIDRGPASAQLISRARTFSLHSPKFIILKGNHEAAMVDSARGDLIALKFWLQHGGDAALASWGLPIDLIDFGPSETLVAAIGEHVPNDVIEWMAKLPLTFRRGNCLFVHAGIRRGVKLSRQSSEDMLWIREDFLGSEAHSGLVVVHGHSVSTHAPVMQHGRIGIDTGAYRSGKLTAVGLENGKHWFLDTHSNKKPIIDSPYELTYEMIL